MSTETIDAGASESAFTPAEEAFFSSGGESEIPRDDESGDIGEKAPAGDAKPAGEVEAKPGDTKAPQNVPLAALHEERSKRKELGGKVTEQEKQIAELNGKLAILLKLKGEGAEGEQKPSGPPSPEDDIFGAVKHTDETVAQLRKRLDDADAATKQATEQTTFVNNYRSDAATFEAKTPDFKAAYNHLLQSRATELIAIGYADPKALQDAGADPADVQKAAKELHDAIVADEFAIAQRAFSSKKSAAETIYNLAKQRGYVAKAADGKPVPKPGETVLETIERGQANNKTLNGAAGGGEDMTAERLLAMPFDEYEDYATKHPGKVKALMGG